MVSRVRLIRWLGPASLVAGILTIALAVARGEANVYLVLIIPIIIGTGPLAFLGILLVFVGFLLTFLLWPWRPDTDSEAPSVLTGSPEGPPPARRWGGGVCLGPIPII